MAKLANKKQILDDAGYRYDLDRSLFLKPQNKALKSSSTTTWQVTYEAYRPEKRWARVALFLQ